MTDEALFQAMLLLFECILVSVGILFLYRLRSRLGPALLYVTLGGFQYMQTVLAMSVYVELVPGFLISPGSAVLFSGCLFAILLIYVRDGAKEARILVYGLVAANLMLTVFSALASLHLGTPLSTNYLSLPTELFLQNISGFILGTALLIADFVLLIMIYEAISKYVTRLLFLRILLSMSIILAGDAIIFITVLFYSHVDYQDLLRSNVVAKLVAALVYSTALWVYFTRFERTEFTAAYEYTKLGNVFNVLTYRDRYDLMRQAIAKDNMTGLYNRGFFDDTFPTELARAARIGHDISLLIVDIDRFKSINDAHGHQAGDKVIMALADTARATLRSGDLACRYGGDEFAIILPDTGGPSATRVAELMRRSFSAATTDILPAAGEPPTITIGLATFPQDAQSPETLFQVADERMYRAKKSGRDCIIGAEC